MEEARMKVKKFLNGVVAFGAISGLLGFGQLDAAEHPLLGSFGCDSNTCDSLVDGSNACGPTLTMSGWLNGGYMYSEHDAPSGYNGAWNQTDERGFMLNQSYLVLEKDVQQSNQTVIGGRLDALWGSDFFLAQSKGFENRPNGASHWNGDDYGIAIPQAYLSMGNRDLSVKAGHFYTLIGFEGVPAPGNFFYSKSNSYMFAGPFTHWGAIGTWNATDRVTFDSGIVNGWDAIDRTTDRAAFLNRVSFGGKSSPTKLSFGIITGDEANSGGAVFSNRTRYSLILSQQLSDRTQYVFHHWMGTQDAFQPNGQNAEWYGIDQYLLYKLNCRTQLGTRFEWFRDDDGVRLGLNRPTNPNKPPYVGNLFSLSTGLNYRPTKSFVLRPEMRYDWFDGAGNPFNDNASDSQFLTGMDAIWTF
jgi:hypothetical protein